MSGLGPTSAWPHAPLPIGYPAGIAALLFERLSHKYSFRIFNNTPRRPRALRCKARRAPFSSSGRRARPSRWRILHQALNGSKKDL